MRQSIQADTVGAIALKDAIAAPAGSLESKVATWYNSLPPGADRDAASAVQSGLAGSGEERNPIIHYKLDKALTHPWNMLIGAEVDLHKRVQMRMEYGFRGRTQLIICYRFNMIEAD